MSRRSYLWAAAVFLALFAATAWLKSRPDGQEPAEAAVQAEGANEEDGNEEVRRFWAAYREATAHRMAGRWEAAAEAYADALAIDGRHEDALYYLGNVRLELGAYAEAGRLWERLAAVNPASARAFAQLGHLHFCRPEAGVFDLDAAEVAYAEALALNPEETGPLLRLGEVALARGALQEAQGYFDDVLGSDTTSVEAHLFGGYAAWARGDRARARRLLDRAYARMKPAEPGPDMPGEGDTKTGLTPLASRASGCPATDALLDEAASHRDREAGEVYARMEQALAQIRAGG